MLSLQSRRLTITVLIVSVLVVLVNVPVSSALPANEDERFIDRDITPSSQRGIHVWSSPSIHELASMLIAQQRRKEYEQISDANVPCRYIAPNKRNSELINALYRLPTNMPMVGRK